MTSASWQTETTTALLASATFTGGARNSGLPQSSNFSSFCAYFVSDQAGTAFIDLSDDSFSWNVAESQAIQAGITTPLFLAVPLIAEYYRVRVVNGGTNQGTFIVRSGWNASEALVFSDAGGSSNVNLADIGGNTVVTGGVNGSLGVGGLAATNTALAGNPNLIGASDGTNVQSVRTLLSLPTSGVGLVASGVASVFNTTFPTYTNGQYGALQMSPQGGLLISGNTGAAAGTIYAPALNAADGLSSANPSLAAAAFGWNYNGSTWDKSRGINGLTTAGTGVPAAGAVGLFSATPSTLTDGQYGTVNITARHALQVAQVATDGVITAASGNVANASAVATLAAGGASKTTYITGFQCTASGSTVGLAVNVTVVGVITGTMTYTFVFPVGVAVAGETLIVSFPNPIPASAVNTAIVVTLPAGGTGNTNAAVNAQGYQL